MFLIVFVLFQTAYYNNDWGLDDKVSTKVDKFKGEAEHWDTAVHNIKKFKEFIPKNKKQLV